MSIPVNMPTALSAIFTAYGGVIKKDKHGNDTYILDKLDIYEFSLAVIQECAEVAELTEALGGNQIFTKILYNFELLPSK